MTQISDRLPLVRLESAKRRRQRLESLGERTDEDDEDRPFRTRLMFLEKRQGIEQTGEGQSNE